MARKRKAADVIDLSDYPEEYLDCRDIRHPWRMIGYWRVRDDYGTRIYQELLCRSCDGRALDCFNDRMERITKRRYRRPVDYKLPGVVTIADIRSEKVRRVKIYDSRDEMLALMGLDDGGVAW